MAEIETVQTQPSAPTPMPKKKNSKGRQKVIKRIISLVIVAALLGTGGLALHRFLNKKEDAGEIFSQPAFIGSIQSKVSGNGNSQFETSKDITLPADATIQVLDVSVVQGDMVSEGQPLFTYSAYSKSAEDAAKRAQDALTQKQKELVSLQESRADLNLRAPFSGKLMDIHEFTKGQTVGRGAPVATLVNDRQLKLSLYFSYAYEHEISVGQSVSVSVPAVMGTFTGRVDQIHKVSYISPEGGIHFEVVIVFDNPGTLTEDMDASAVLTASDGTPIYPYNNGKTRFSSRMDIATKAGGPVVQVGNLHNYANVEQGESLLVMSSEDLDAEISQLMLEVEAAQATLDEAMKSLGTFEVTSPITGSIMACNLEPDAEIQTGPTGLTAVMIANNSKMIVNIQVDDRNISFIKPGSIVELKDWNDNTYEGVVTKIDMSGAQQGQGMTTYPVTLTVDNYSGQLQGGMWLTYSFVTSESLDCVVVPAASVQYFADKEGNRQSVVFVKRDVRPDDVPELELPTFGPEDTPTFPSEEEGYYPVIVETGLADVQNVEIISGVQADDEVFVAFTVKDSAGSW